MLLSMVDSHLVDESGRVNKHEILLFLPIDFHNVDSDVVNQWGWVLDILLGSVQNNP